ncbi:translocation/assembly module TamB [Maribellus maritimus]|uniref:translocation/assembly module TamB domain-containing protein n=1 Tax=Maribellus maritimus TaxID=2870838 RepID=UPI001EE9F3E1|nr:translocation/assembly module TamB domain-containing protein [Maribellus maritimus]MCG6188110.1 translocation/assembly module TamB [Maribellus maritimus]
MVLAVIFLLLSGGYFSIQNSRVQTYLTQLFANQLSKQVHSKITVGKVKIAFFNKVILNDVLVEDLKSDTLFFTQKLSAKIDTLRIKKKHVTFDELSLINNKINIERDSLTHFNFSHIISAFRTQKDTVNFWEINCNNFSFHQSEITFNDLYAEEKEKLFLNNINFDISDFELQPDSILFRINELNLNDGKNLFVNSLSANFAFFGDSIRADSLYIKSNKSEIQNTSVSINFDKSRERSISSAKLDVRFSNSNISFLEVAELVPSLRGMDMNVNLSGQIYGTLNDLKGKNLVIRTGENTSAFFDFYMNDVTDVENMYLFVDLKLSKTNFADLSKIKLPSASKIRTLSFPEPFYEAGTITYRGNFSGFLNDFVTFGTFSSTMGTLTTDVSVMPQSEGTIKYRGKIDSRNFELGELFKIKNIGKVTFDGNVDGTFNKTQKTLNGKFNGFISELEAYDYTYQNIALDGTLDKHMFDGLLVVNDPNLVFDFTGQVNLNPEIPEFDFNLHMDKALPGKLNLSSNFPASEIAFNMAANFKGDKLDNLEGFIMVEDGFYKNRNGQFTLNGMELNSVQTDTTNLLTFNSDFFNIKVSGKYHFQSILDAFKKNANRYLPATNYEKLSHASENIFDFQIEANDLDTLTTIFTPKYKVETPFLLYGKLDSENTAFELEGSIPGIATKNLLIKNIFIGNKPTGDEYASKFRFGEVVLRNGMALYNLTFDSKISDDIIDNQITWANSEDSTYSGTIKTKTTFLENDSTDHPLVTIEGAPTKIFIGDSVWQISPFSAMVDSTTIEINNFRFFKQDQQITIDGKISEDKSNILSAKFENINLGSFDEYLKREFDISGILDGSAGIFDFYNQRMILSDVGITDFRFKKQKIGNIVFTNYWNSAESVLNSELEVENNGKQRLYARGNYTPAGKKLNYDITTDSLSVVLLETLIRKNLSDIHGYATGHLKLHGGPEKLLIDGALLGSNAGLTIDYTQVEYTFNDSVYFRQDTILFDNITILDEANNTGIFDGTLVHTNFQDMIYNLSLGSQKILALNTLSNNNEQFYGKVFANGRVQITGFRKDVTLSGSGTTLPGTSVNIMLENESEIEQYDFIQFVADDKPEEPKFYFTNNKEDEGDFQMNLTIRATADARAQLIYNSQIGDVIKAQGEGILLFGMNSEGDITLSGDYTVAKGDYLFTLQNVINKRFSIEQGGTLTWSGDPYNADIDLNAIYKLKASLYDLLVKSYNNIYQSQRVPVECKIKLTEELSNPNIDFEIDFPSTEERIIAELQQYFSTDEEMNKQILSLLVLGKFYTPEYLRGTFAAQNPNVIGTTASELFSNQLSNWLSQISSNWDIGLNYRPGDQITNDEIELGLSTQMFNDRVTINGNIGNNANPNSTNNSQLVGDFDINVKLIPSGKIQLKAYNRSNNNIYYETAPYTQGVGFSVQEDYNTFEDLLQKLRSLFRKKKSNE